MRAYPIVVSMYWDNIPLMVLQKQREVFEVLQIPLKQELANGVRHGVWMNDVLRRAGPDDLVVFCDIDAFPLNRAAHEFALAQAQAGSVFGLAQFSNHRPTKDTYAGPMYMALQKGTWERLGRPDMRSSKTFDAAEGLSLAARSQGVPLTLVKPTACLVPKYALGNEGLFGIGTFYGDNDFFHLFESRDQINEQILEAVANDVIAGRPLQFGLYLQIAQASSDASSPLSSAKRGKWQAWFQNYTSRLSKS
jgi:hypothetical protein